MVDRPQQLFHLVENDSGDEISHGFFATEALAEEYASILEPGITGWRSPEQDGLSVVKIDIITDLKQLLFSKRIRDRY